MKQTLKNILLLFLFSFFSSVFSQWTPDAYINDFKVNDDATARNQNTSRIGVDSAGNFVVAWNDRRNFADDQRNQVYCQVFDKWSNRIGNNFRIGQDTTILADIAILEDGRFIVFWTNYFYVGILFRYEMCYQRFDKTGAPLTLILKVVDTNYSQGAQTFQGGGDWDRFNR